MYMVTTKGEDIKIEFKDNHLQNCILKGKVKFNPDAVILFGTRHFALQYLALLGFLGTPAHDIINRGLLR